MPLFMFTRSLCAAVVLFTSTSTLHAQAVVSGSGLLAAQLPGGKAGMPAESLNALDKRIDINVVSRSVRTVLEEISAQSGVRFVYGEPVGTVRTTVTIRRSNISVRDALGVVLSGTGLRYRVTETGQVVVTSGAANTPRAQGTIMGRVIDGSTKRPIAGATVQLDGTNRVTQTDHEGSFQMTNVPPGEYTVAVRRLGYAKVSRSISVGENATTNVDIALDVSANALDQVVVTGTIVQTELKAVPSAISVVTAKDIEERGITKIDQLFRGDIPGLFALNLGAYPTALLNEVTMFSRGATALSSASVPGSLTGNSNPIKTYVDGIELADPKYLSQIDPKAIERIEILTGPQASTIYGSNAINGVMQIFTKRGSTPRPQLSFSLLSGWIENNFSSARTPQHDYSAQLSGIEGRFSYNAGGSWNYMGPWTPAKQTARTGGFGGARLELPTPAGRVTADMTLRRSITQSLQRGATNQTETGHREIGWWTNLSHSGLDRPATRTLTGQTLGITLTYAAASWWSHELGFGTDASDAEMRYTARGYTSINDTTLSVQQSHTDRRSLRYATTAHLPLASLAHLTVTAGADTWQNLTSSWSVSPQTLTGPLTGSTSVSRQPGHNAGGFLQSQLGIKDRLFLTYGLRAEWNPGFGEEAQPNYAPRYGVAYTQELGPVTAKLRGSYGRSTRPPQPRLKAALTAAEGFGSSSWSSILAPYYAPFAYFFANPDLAPEHQQGGEGGLELYLGTRGSLVVTRYNQTVDGLIARPQVDSVRSQTACRPACYAFSQDAEGHGYIGQYQYLNIGSIRNQGWELQGSMHVGPLTTRGTYSWTKSRTIGVNPKYRAFFANQPQYQPGATFQYLPEHTWAFGVTYAKGASAVGFNLTGMGRATNFRDDFYLQRLDGSIRLPQNRLNVSNISRYINFNSAYALADLTASHRFLPRVEGVLQVQNLMDRYTSDFYAASAALGRQVKAGLRLR